MAFWERVHARAESALAAGVMHSFECELEVVSDGGVDFVLRRATHFPKGETAAGRGPEAAKLPSNPFLSPEPALVVEALGDTHVALLNKFSVLREHLLVVTRTFVDQRTPLDLADFEALARVMDGAEVLAFYNGGREAGASQGHKHLQVVTLPLSPRRAVPMASLLEPGGPRPPFPHAFLPLAPGELARPVAMLAKYQAAMQEARVGERAYNMVLVREGLLVVPRVRDKFADVSINALAFAGSLFVRDAAHRDRLVEAGLMNALQGVTAQP
jgi:ATP adenylyltransferase